MSFGVLGSRGSAALFGRARPGGAVRGTEAPCKEPPALPWTCWDKPGFKECHAIAFKAAQGECEFRGLKDNDCCINSITNTVVEETCADECPELKTRGESGQSTLVTAALIAAGAYAVLALIGGDT